MTLKSKFFHEKVLIQFPPKSAQNIVYFKPKLSFVIKIGIFKKFFFTNKYLIKFNLKNATLFTWPGQLHQFVEKFAPGAQILISTILPKNFSFLKAYQLHPCLLKGKKNIIFRRKESGWKDRCSES
jgi:hypothetical protein